MAGGDLIPTPLPPLKPSFFIGEVPIFPHKPTFAETVKNSKEKPLSLGAQATPNSIETKLSLLHKGSLQLKPLASHLGKCSVIFKKSDKAMLIDRLNYVLIAKFSHGRPAIDSVHKFLLHSNIKGDYVLSVFYFKHVFIEFALFEDFSRIWLKRNWVIQGFPVKIFKWSDEFIFSKESSIVPVWVHLPRLPLYLFEEESLMSIANAIGKPLHIDKANLNRTKLGYASFCVEMDVSKPPLEDLWIEFEDECPSSMPDGFWQSIVYVDIPRFCVGCHHMGHSVEACKRRLVDIISHDTGVKLSVEKDASDVVEMKVGITNEIAGLELKGVQQDAELLCTQTGPELKTQGQSMQTWGVDHVGEFGDDRDPSAGYQEDAANAGGSSGGAVNVGEVTGCLVTSDSMVAEGLVTPVKVAEGLGNKVTQQIAGIEHMVATQAISGSHGVLGYFDIQSDLEEAKVNSLQEGEQKTEANLLQNLCDIAAMSDSMALHGNRMKKRQQKNKHTISEQTVKSFAGVQGSPGVPATLSQDGPGETAEEDTVLLHSQEQNGDVLVDGDVVPAVECVEEEAIIGDDVLNVKQEPGADHDKKATGDNDVLNAYSMFIERMQRLRDTSSSFYAASSLSPVGRSSKKLSKLRKRVEHLKCEEGTAFELDKEAYKELDELLNENLLHQITASKEQRKASSTKDSTEIVSREMIADASQEDEQDWTTAQRRGRNRNRKK